MFTPRGITVAAGGLAMWVVARIIGSPGLEVVGLGLAALPVVALAVAARGRRRLELHRHVSDRRVQPGARVAVELEVVNRSVTGASVLLVEDRLPPTLGRPARMVVTDLPGRSTRRIAYAIVPQVRGRYTLGPITVDATDAYGLTRRRITLDERDELTVTPAIEDLRTTPSASTGASFGSARARQLLRVGEEYYTMREYHLGDDLRRIHWPSVARTGDLMIRQDEATRRASGLVFVDQRQAAIGQSRGAAFERAVSAAASVGVLLARAGFQLRFASAEHAPGPVTEDRFLDALAALAHSQARTIAPALTNLRAAASADTSLVFISGPPAPSELAGLLRAGSGFGPRLAILVYPLDPASLPADRQTHLEGRASQARLALARAGWDCIVLSPSNALTDRWHTPAPQRLASNA
ncbi:MAG TPA: DUF58 domain-containing protein [Actinomycetota bacterium]|nr:DUF58 domain-containing protein [Actinomycetota bacterium]